MGHILEVIRDKIFLDQIFISLSSLETAHLSDLGSLVSRHDEWIVLREDVAIGTI